MFSLEVNKKRMLRTTLVTLSVAIGTVAGFFALIFIGMPLWEHVIAPASNFVVNDLFGDFIKNSGLLGGVLFGFSYILFNIYFLLFLIAGGYFAAKCCLRLIKY